MDKIQLQIRNDSIQQPPTVIIGPTGFSIEVVGFAILVLSTSVIFIMVIIDIALILHI